MLANPDYLRHRTEMNADPLSDMLTLLNARCLMSGRLIAGGPWSLRFPRPDAVKVSAVIKGYGWLVLDNGAAPIRVEAGDVMLLNGRHSFVLTSDLSLEPLDAVAAFRAERAQGVARLGEGEDFYYIGGHVAIDSAGADLLRDALPPVIHIRGSAPEAGILAWLLDQLFREMRTEQPGAALATAQLAQLMFVQVLRSHIAASQDLSVGWLRAIGDPQIAPAMRLMHADPGRAWQLGELARAVGMSRTSFALRFKAVAGVSPLNYLTEWRMRLAEHALREGDRPVSAIALSLGYTSESAFSNAFKRVTGNAPKRYRSAIRAIDGSVIVQDLSMPEPAPQPFRIAS